MTLCSPAALGAEGRRFESCLPDHDLSCRAQPSDCEAIGKQREEPANAGPIIENSASDIQERAGRVADKVENVDVDVDVNTADDKPKAK